ncbi:ribosomal small subunit pseudouridine synthase A [Dongia mobilis]|uniref:Ribosomal small subunit pseudouridine synthase A n=1 Tax=Dongia mobilis TaxID=578943 RepID=A0A4R6WR80_9PROT|nr:pseudouridine synthase [Dongia mobilis]TDQ82027.1 ribosomal small subunit pseudouridine synthase A [Dongia mobilis]
MKLVKHLANLGYGSRKEVAALLRNGRITDAAGNELDADSEVAHHDIRLNGAPLDPDSQAVIMLHKPLGFTCSTRDPGRIIYDLLPMRWRLRKPAISPVGRLDRDTTGLLLLTADGAFLHRIISPKSNVPKVYEVTLARPMKGDEAALFASGTMMLESEEKPLLPAELVVIDPIHARLTLHEGRYHQVRRMFAATGNHVEALHRSVVGGIDLGDLAEGKWRELDAVEKARVILPQGAPA